MIHLPDELIFNITSMLPLKSVINMMCLTKNSLNFKDIVTQKKIEKFRFKHLFKKFKMKIYDLKIKNVTSLFIQNLIDEVLINIQGS